MKHIKNLFLVFFVLAGSSFSSCVSPEETNYLQNLNINYPMQPYEEYRLMPDDYIMCAIYTKNEDFTSVYQGVVGTSGTSGRSFMIYDNGAINVPMFGEIYIAGLTIQEAEVAIRKNIREAIPGAQVKVGLASSYFSILSDGPKGRFEIYKDNMTIFQALAVVGQTDERFDLTNVRLLRKDIEGNTVIKAFDLRTQDIIQSEFYYIKPNDVIYLSTSKKNFFNINSLSSFFSTAAASLAFLLFAATYK